MAQEKAPLYPTLLRLRSVHPNAWQRALLGEGMALLGAILVMADLASGWAILVLPLAMAVVVKAHDLLSGLLSPPAPDMELVELRRDLDAVRAQVARLRGD